MRTDGVEVIAVPRRRGLLPLPARATGRREEEPWSCTSVVEELRPLVLSSIDASPGEADRAQRHVIPGVDMHPDTDDQFVGDALVLDANVGSDWVMFLTPAAAANSFTTRAGVWPIHEPRVDDS